MESSISRLGSVVKRPMVMKTNFTHHSGWNVYTTKLSRVHKRSCHFRLGVKDFFEKNAQEIPLTLIVLGGADMVLLATVEGVFTYWAPPSIYIYTYVYVYTHPPICIPFSHPESNKKREGIYYLIINRLFGIKNKRINLKLESTHQLLHRRISEGRDVGFQCYPPWN